MVENLTGKKNETDISIPGNQMYVIFHTNGENTKKGFSARIVESMYILHFGFFK